MRPNLSYPRNRGYRPKQVEILIWLRAWNLAKKDAFELSWGQPRIREVRIRKFLQAAQEELEGETIHSQATPV